MTVAFYWTMSRIHQYTEVLHIIQKGQAKAFEAVNVALIETYWTVGTYLSQKVSAGGWGKGVINELAKWLTTSAPDTKGFSASNLWRMKQFFETWHGLPKLATVLRELSWSKHLLLMSQCSDEEERQFYLISAIRARWSHRELQRQIRSAAFERTVLTGKKRPSLNRTLPQKASGVFKDSYLLDFINLPERYSEADLQFNLLKNLQKFLMELGHGFSFIGEKVRVQVGNRDFLIDLLFYHRDLQCLVAFELKVGQFEPEHLGQLSFYLEALDRDYKRPHENPSIGVLLCREKDDEVVEYALSRHLSPALVAQYKTQLIPKAVLQKKLHEWNEMLKTSKLSKRDKNT